MPQSARELTPEEVAEGERGITSVDLTATQLQAHVHNMDHSKKKWRHLERGAYLEKLKQENEVLYFNYPSLWQMHAEDRMDSTFFEMLALKRKIEKGQITPEEASALVGKKLFNRFVPQSTTPVQAPTMSYEDYYKQFASN